MDLSTEVSKKFVRLGADTLKKIASMIIALDIAILKKISAKNQSKHICGNDLKQTAQEIEKKLVFEEIDDRELMKEFYLRAKPNHPDLIFVERNDELINDLLIKKYGKNEVLSKEEEQQLEFFVQRDKNNNVIRENYFDLPKLNDFKFVCCFPQNETKEISRILEEIRKEKALEANKGIDKNMEKVIKDMRTETGGKETNFPTKKVEQLSL